MTETRTKLIWAALLTVVTIAVYWPVSGSDFINYDDPDYVTRNPMVQHGITAPSLSWAFTSSHASNWHPLTWISHMLDCSLFGLKPGGHHAVSLFFHTANALLLFGLLTRLSGTIWRSGLVAALFAWHPLHVESVAWVSERKDVLSAFFWMLTLLAYAQKCQVLGPKSRFLQIAALIFFACGLMSKPMVVTLPFVLLLLDFWPLGRFYDFATQQRRESFGAPLFEKVPFLVLSGIACVITIWTQRAEHSVVNTAAFPLSARTANVLVSYVRYLFKTVWPVDLALPYSFSHDWTFWQAAGAGTLLAGITALVVIHWRMRPYLAVGWFWFLGTLVPVIGLVQVGTQSMADRYTYLPLIGIFILAVWSIPGAWAAWPRPGLMLASAVSAILVLLLLATSLQVTYWKNSISLFTHTTAVTSGNILAEYNLGEALAASGDDADAVSHYQKALAMVPNRVEAQYNSQPQAHFNLGVIYFRRGQLPEAEAQFRAAVLADPGQLAPHNALGIVLTGEGKIADAESEFREAVKIDANFVEAANRLAWLLATSAQPEFRNGADAVQLAEHARDLTGSADPKILSTLDAAYAEAGRMSDAITTATLAAQLAASAGQTNLATAAQERLKLYQSGRPFRQ